MYGNNYFGPNCKVAEDAVCFNSYLENVVVESGVQLINAVVRGKPDKPLFIRRGAEIIRSTVEVRGKFEEFSFAQWEIAEPEKYQIGEKTRIIDSYIQNSFLGSGVEVYSASVRSSLIGDDSTVRPNGNIYRSYLAPNSRIGSELSKTILKGSGFTSEHQNSYLSLVAPSHYPLIDEKGREILSPELPNLTNIGAGTVFANYSGKPKPAESLERSTGSQKGTAVVFSSFTAVNATIVNRYGQPPKGLDLFSLLRERELTILGFGSFVERKCTGGIPAFSYASQTSARKIKIGWVLERHPGIILNFVSKMKKLLGANSGALGGLIEGIIRLEIQLLGEELKREETLFDREELKRGLAIFQKNLDGRWKLDEKGDFVYPWRWSEQKKSWYCEI